MLGVGSGKSRKARGNVPHETFPLAFLISSPQPQRKHCRVYVLGELFFLLWLLIKGVNVVSFKWPSVIYALDILAWDWFYGLSLLFAAPVFKRGRLQTAVCFSMAMSGVLSIAGLIFLPFGDIQLRMIGILGYAGLAPVVFLLLAIVLGRAGARSLGSELRLLNNKEGWCPGGHQPR